MLAEVTRFHSNTWSEEQPIEIWASFLDSRYKQRWFLPIPFAIGWKRKNRLCVYCVYVYPHTNYCFLRPKASLQSSPVRCISPSARLPFLKLSLLIFHLPTAWRKKHSVVCPSMKYGLLFARWVQRLLGSIPIPAVPDPSPINQIAEFWVSGSEMAIHKQLRFLSIPSTLTKK